MLSADSLSNAFGYSYRGAIGATSTAPPNSFIINLGELMKTWTNDRWRATRHRVLPPRTPAENVDRLSFAFSSIRSRQRSSRLFPPA
jgi:hypothetical protein